MKCFLCNKIFVKNEYYFEHLKSYHFLKTSDDYKCCGTVYSNSSRFKVHVRKKHPTTTSSIVCGSLIHEEKVNEVQTDRASKSSLAHHEKDSELFININVNKNKSDEELLRNIHENILVFETALFSKCNFARSDAENICEEILNLLIEPLLLVFSAYCKKYDKEIYLQISNFTDKININFKNLSTQYRLRKMLMSQDLLSELEEVTVETTASLTHQKGNLECIQKEIKIAFMPMTFTFKKVVEKNDNLLNMIKFMEEKKNLEYIENITQGSLWKKSAKCIRTNFLFHIFYIRTT